MNAATLQIDLHTAFESPIALGPESPVWSLALLRDHEHSIHGVSGREASSGAWSEASPCRSSQIIGIPVRSSQLADSGAGGIWPA